MTLEQIRGAIRIQSHKDQHGGIKLTAELKLRSEMTVNDHHDPLVLNYAKNELRDNLIAILYEDRRQGLYELTHRLESCNPMEFVAHRKALDDLVAYCRHLPPPPEPTSAPPAVVIQSPWTL